MDTEKCDGMQQCQKDKAIRQAQEAAIREHQWEHKQPAPFPGLKVREDVAGFGIAQNRNVRTFTREEVLTALRAIHASKGGLAEAIVAFENTDW